MRELADQSRFVQELVFEVLTKIVNEGLQSHDAADDVVPRSFDAARCAGPDAFQGFVTAFVDCNHFRRSAGGGLRGRVARSHWHGHCRWIAQLDPESEYAARGGRVPAPELLHSRSGQSDLSPGSAPRCRRTPRGANDWRARAEEASRKARACRCLEI